METKPPLGLKPRKIHDQDRMNEIISAIERYSEESMLIPKEWTDELRDLANPRIFKNLNHNDLVKLMGGK